MLAVLVSIVPILAQDTVPIPDGVDTSGITDDQVNAVASQLYCPVCENIPLDTCGTAACQDWREEIRIMLATGMSPQEIIDNFVRRFGDRVVGTPQDPVLRTLSLVTPWIVVLLGVMVAVWTLLKWQQRSGEKVKAVPAFEELENNPYRDVLESDLAG